MSKLNIVDEDDNIVGEATREEIHQQGLLHREIHVWLYTPNGEIVFQRRGENKDTFPNLLDASAGGHVELGDSWQEAAIKELKEETGIEANADGLDFIVELQVEAHDQVTGAINRAIRREYAYLYKGEVSDLRVEPDEAEGFEAWEIDELLNLLPKQQTDFISTYFTEEYLDVFRNIKKLLE